MENLQFHLKTDAQQKIINGSDSTLSIINSESLPTVVPDDIFGHCLQFDGEKSYLQLPSMNDIDYSKGFTVSFWGWYDSFNLWSRIIDFGNGPGITNVALVNIKTSDQLRFRVQASYVDKSNVLELGRWIHLAVTISPDGTPTLYKDGGEIDVVFESIQPQVNVTLNYIGKSNYSNEDKLFHGKIAHLRIYNKALTLTEIRQDMAVDHPDFALMLHLPLNELEMPFADHSLWQHPITVTGVSPKPDAIFDSIASFEDPKDVLEITPPLQITGDHSLSFFMQPDNIEEKRNLTTEQVKEDEQVKDESGIYLEADGRLTYRYQIPDSEPVVYEDFSSAQSLPFHQWSHVTLIKDLSNRTLAWYINGQLDKEMNIQNHPFPETSHLTSLVKRNDGAYQGKLAQFRIHQKALSRDAIDNLLQIDTLAKEQESLRHRLWAFLTDNAAQIESDYDTYTFFLKSFDFSDADALESFNLGELSVNQLQALQRLIRLTDGIASFSLLTALNLLERGMASAMQISEMSAAQFIQNYSGAFIPNQHSAETQANSVFQEALARRSKALLTHIALVQHGEPHYGSSRVNNLRSPTREAATDRLPSSQKIFDKL